MKLHHSSAVLLLLCAFVSQQFVAAEEEEEEEEGQSRELRTGQEKVKNVKKIKNFSGVDDLEGYKKVEKAFVGVNPIMGAGSGFITTDIEVPATFGTIPESGGARVDLCTCDCKAGSDGVGCTGYGGVNFRYSSLLWTEPDSDKWTGQMQAFQQASVALHFMGTDTRVYPGGAAVYNFACTQQDCNGLFSGVFRQANGPVSCLAGIEDEDMPVSNGCFLRCANSETYTDWLEYCKADKEDTTSGFSGYGI
jgi:hypothetical protein